MKKLFIIIASLVVSSISFGKSLWGTYLGTIKSNFTTKSEVSGNAIGNPRIPVTVASTKAKREKKRELIVMKGDGLKCKIIKIVESIEDDMTVSIYDSENAFERDQIAKALATTTIL